MLLSIFILFSMWNSVVGITESRQQTFAHPYQDHLRYRRNVLDQTEQGTQVFDLNSTVPYIFSARVYPYGPSNGDLASSSFTEPYRLENSILFLGSMYDTIYIHKDGSIGLTPSHSDPSPLPSPYPTMAIFWQKTKGVRVYYRETDDPTTINLAYNEVNIQYRYGSSFRVKSVLIITWEGGSHIDLHNNEGNIFQLALIIGEKMTFAHIIYSQLTSYNAAVAGFSANGNTYSLPDSGTTDVALLAKKSDIGIPGEWLFQIDSEQVFLCGAGFKGLECIESCAPSQWSNDCLRSCHCDGGDSCDQESGACPTNKCSPGWDGAPICDKDIDECLLSSEVCPSEQPDCINTPGSFLCLCYEYDEQTKSCKGSLSKKNTNSLQIDVVQVSPNLPQSSKFSGIRFPSAVSKEKKCNCDLNAECINEECVCKSGWEGDGKQCRDVDECRLVSSCTSKNTRCVNVPGSYQCQCLYGYTRVNGHCVDINECSKNPCGTDVNIRCVNLLGSYVCQCEDGFYGNATVGCIDINECETIGACGDNAICTNMEGGYECECEDGFERISEIGGCRDVDECSVYPCHAAAECVNLEGSFECHCLDGYIGDGLDCHETVLFPIANDSIVIPRSTSESVVNVVLAHPIRLFGRNCKEAFISTNGLISFDAPFTGEVNKPYNLGKIVIFTLHSAFNYTNQGLIAYTYVNSSDTAASALISRSSNSISQQYGILEFSTQNLHIFTFDRMLHSINNKSSSFQVVISESDTATFVTLIYEKIGYHNAIVGIVTPQSYYPLPAVSIDTQSNVGIPGKWILRVDGHLVACPMGHQNPPYCTSTCDPGYWGHSCTNICHCSDGNVCDPSTGICPNKECQSGWTGVHCNEDIDECVNLVTCGNHSTCINSIGSFECHCEEGYTLRDNNICEPINNCLQKYKISCDVNAICNNKQECTCISGYSGDGFTCFPEKNISSTETTIFPLQKESTTKLNVPVTMYPFIMNSWIPQTVTVQTTQRPYTPTTAIISTTLSQEGETETLTMLFLAMPGALCVVWFVLVAVVIIMCWKHKRRNSSQAEKYRKNINVWRKSYTPTLDVSHYNHRAISIEPKMVSYDY